MAVASDKPVEKQGFLGLGFKEGESLPPELLDVDHHIDEEGRIKWRIRDRYLAWLDTFGDIIETFILNRGEIKLFLFRNLNNFKRVLMGLPALNNSRRLNLAMFDVSNHPEFETAPQMAQTALLKGAAKYLGLI